MYLYFRENALYLGVELTFRKPSLEVRFDDDTPRTPKPADFVSRLRANSIWRRGPASCLLPAAWPSRPIAAMGSFCSEEQRVLHQRNDRGVAVSSYPRLGAGRDHRAVAPQWGLSVLGRTSPLPSSHDAPSLSGAFWPLGARQIHCTPRPVAKGNAVPCSPESDCDLRFGYNRADCLRSTARCGRWFQSHQARSSVLPAPVVLRGNLGRYFLRQLSSRQYSSEHCDPATTGRRLRQASQCYPSGACARRWSVLRSQNYRIYRRKTGLVCDCRSTDSNRFGTALVGFATDALDGKCGQESFDTVPMAGNAPNGSSSFVDRFQKNRRRNCICFRWDDTRIKSLSPIFL